MFGTENNFMGFSNFYWAIGIVEDRNDPTGKGRARVRCFGIHTQNKSHLPTKDLPWARTCLPLTDPTSVPKYKEGDEVMIFFMDGLEAQKPCIMFVISSEDGGNKNYQKGFSDPEKTPENRPTYPKDYSPDKGLENNKPQNYQQGDFVPQVNSYASTQNYELTPAYKAKQKYRISNIPSTSGTKFSEPENAYKAKFPYNDAKESESGHVFEMDDTPANERIHLFHKSGSYLELLPKGDTITKSIQNCYNLSGQMRYTYTQENSFESILKNANVYVGENYNLEVNKGNLNITAKKGNCTITINGTSNVTINGDANLKVGGNYNITTGGDFIVNGSSIRLN